MQVSIVQGEAYVWSAASIALLRRKHGIVGLLTGSLPLIPQQNAFLGVPLQLFEEEVVYLARRKAIILVDDTKAHNVDGMRGDALNQWHAQRLASILEQRRAAAEEARESKEKWKQQLALSDAAMEKKKSREMRRLQDTVSIDVDEAASLQPDPESKPLDDDAGARNTSHLLTIPSASADLPWHTVRLGDNAFDSLSSAANAGLWRYPSNADQRARCAVFEALRAKGYYMGKGLRFGGDFVVYPGEACSCGISGRTGLTFASPSAGDPLRYHSHFTATVQTTPQSPVSAHELIAAGRLGTAVKKAHLLCSVRSPLEGQGEEAAWLRRTSGDDDEAGEQWGEVDFISLTWAGFGV